MGIELDGVRGVPNFYGPRTSSEGISGTQNTLGKFQEFTVEFTSDNINDDDFAAAYVATLPAGAKIVGVYAEIEEAFALGGTTPTINVGTDGSETTNGVEISEAQAEAVGVYDITGTLAGTFTSELAADTAVSVVLDGTTPTASGGKAVVTFRYLAS